MLTVLKVNRLILFVPEELIWLCIYICQDIYAVCSFCCGGSPTQGRAYGLTSFLASSVSLRNTSSPFYICDFNSLTELSKRAPNCLSSNWAPSRVPLCLVAGLSLHCQVELCVGESASTIGSLSVKMVPELIDM